MGKVKASISMSLDGFIAGPNANREQGLGAGGEQLHEWVLKTQSWRESHHYEGGETGPDDDVMAADLEGLGAVIMGRRMFGADDGPWGDDPWNGWWGDNPPFGGAVFVLTHHEREPLALSDTTFHFVTDGIESALEQARAAAGDGHISIAGGAQTIQQYLRADAVDELHIHQVPVFLGSGTRLFEDVPPKPLELIETQASPAVTHLRYRVRQAAD